MTFLQWAHAKTEPTPSPATSIQTEIEPLDLRPETQDLRLLLDHALIAVQPLALRRKTSFSSHVPAEPVMLSTDPVIARQILVNTLSQAVSRSANVPINLTLTNDSLEATLSVSYTPESAQATAPEGNAVVAQLAQRLGWKILQEVFPGPVRVINVRMAAHCASILVIDDNVGFLELMETYLAGHACRVLTARSGREGLLLAQETPPDAIILDVMMPDVDGWEFLQRLRNHPQTNGIPVIVCSVINNPDLAYSLGASHVLTKAVSQQDVLAALRQMGVL